MEGIKTAREAAGLNQSELARKLGVQPSAVCRMEQPNGYPKAEKLPAIADALDTSIDALFGRGERRAEVVAPYGDAVGKPPAHGEAETILPTLAKCDAGGEAPACGEVET